MPNNHLTTFLESLKTDIIHSLQSNGKYATGQTAQQINIDTDNLQLQLPAYIQILESGRGPTGKNAIPGSLPMIDRIKEWCQAKGIPEKAAWAIKKSIDKNGFKGTPSIISGPLCDANIDLRLGQAIDPMSDEIAQQIIDSIGLS